MEVKLVQRKEIIIGGFSVETTLQNSQNDVEKLYNDFFNVKKELLNGFTKKTNEYYGIIWYTILHESYKYLIGQEIIEKSKKIEFKIIPEGQYAYSKFPKDYDGIKAWTEFYEKGIPGIGYKPIEKDDMAFEYYPNGIDGDYELWSLVEKA
jgi:hypothetical protein